jgi:esterase/lipase
MNKLEKLYIQSFDDTIACIIDYQTNREDLNTIFLHGGGPSSKENTEYLVPVFMKNSKYCIRFDFSGQGESSGILGNSSLTKRYKETINVLKAFNADKKPLTVVGTSMSGHIACKLASELPIENLILFCPAAYSREAWDIEFENGFTDILRKNKSYEQNNIHELLTHYTGKILLILAENDEIIPNEVINIYKEEVKIRKGSKTYIIRNCPHPIHKWIVKNETEQRALLQEVNKFLSKEEIA